jgi:hypothetical protein
MVDDLDFSDDDFVEWLKLNPPPWLGEPVQRYGWRVSQWPAEERQKAEAAFERWKEKVRRKRCG